MQSPQSNSSSSNNGSSDTALSTQSLSEERLSENSSIRKVVLDDRKLVDRCLAGDQTAWEELYHQQHQPLMNSIKALLGQNSRDANTVEEIAARVWYSMTTNNSQRLNRFDVQRNCRLSTYISLVAWDEMNQLFRSEGRRRIREQTSTITKRPVTTEEPESGIASQIEEFLEMLTPTENDYFVRFLIHNTDESPEVNGKNDHLEGKNLKKYSISNQWQLKSRIEKKLIQFLGNDSKDVP
ncbi:MAG: hypothetical protein COA78_29415 [Blastopirellula sp.]|nr:MAG: hypothetical protein COA78_29415 [Blastopirellula sp.]